MKNKVVKHFFLIFLTLIIVCGTLFIPQKVSINNKPEVKLGYPIYFISLDFTNHYPDFPDERVKNIRFNILSSWEKYGEIYWNKFLLSYFIIFVTLEILLLLKHKLNLWIKR